MLYLALLVVFMVPFSNAQETNLEGDKSQCIKRMVDWCNSMQYSQNNTGMSMISLSYGDSNSNYRVFCVAESDGTNCSRNGSPWFSCAPDRTLTYKGQVMTESSTNVDDDICNTTKKAFDELSLQNMTNSNILNMNMEKYMKQLHDEMTAMMNMFKDFRMEFGPVFGGGFDESGVMFPELDFEGNDSEQTSTEDSNQIEKEFE